MSTLRERGKLRDLADARLGSCPVAVRRCDDCDTNFTSPLPDWRNGGYSRPFTINGVVNDGLCPWCREDSAPGRHGRVL